MIDIPLDTAISILVILAGLLIMVRGFTMPQSFYENEEKRQELKRRVMEIEEERGQVAAIISGSAVENDTEAVHP